MSNVIIYHNPRCSKSREALILLQEHQQRPEVIEYLKSPPNKKELTKLLKQLGMKPQELVRTGEAIYKELNLASKKLSDQEWLDLLIKHPILIERPIVVVNDKAIVARPPSKLLELL